MPDPEASAEIGDASLPAERSATGRGECREAADRLCLGCEVRKLRADVDVYSEHVDSPGKRVSQDDLRLLRWKPELRAMVPGHDRLVRIGVDAERDAYQSSFDACASRQPRLVGRVEHHGGTLGGRGREKRLVLVVPVHDELRAREPRLACERELAGRGDVGPDALFAEESEQRDVGEGLGSVEHPAALAD